MIKTCGECVHYYDGGNNWPGCHRDYPNHRALDARCDERPPSGCPGQEARTYPVTRKLDPDSVVIAALACDD